MIARTFRMGLLLVLLVVLQTSVFPHLRIAGVVPDLGLVAAIAISVHYGPEFGGSFGFAAGLASDLFLQTPLGLSALAFALTAYIVGVLQSRLMRPAWWVAPVLAGAAGVVGGVLFVGIGGLVGQDQLFVLHSIRTILFAAVYDGLVAVVLFPLATAVARPDPRSQAAIRAPGY